MPSIPKKTVKFSADTSFQPGRETEKFWRRSGRYVSGKYAPKGKQQWLDTSMMSDILEHLLDLRVHRTHTAHNETEIHALYDEMEARMNTGEPLCLGAEAALREHPLYQEVLNVYVAFRESDDFDGCSEDGLKNAKALVIYQDCHGEFQGFQFLHAASEDSEADAYVQELRKNIPAGNHPEL